MEDDLRVTARGLSETTRESSASAQRRLRAANALLLEHPDLLVGVGSAFGDGHSFESAIKGSSMEPAIPRQTRVRARIIDKGVVAPGDIAFYLAESGYVIHRVLHVDAADYVLTFGDNCWAPDPPVLSSDLLGVVTAVKSGDEWIPPGPLAIHSFAKRAVRRVGLLLMSAALPSRTRFARRLALTLRRVELDCRLFVPRLRSLRRRCKRKWA